MAQRTCRRAGVLALALLGIAGAGCMASYDQEQKDRDLLFGVRLLLTDLWNGHIAHTSAGAKDITVTLPGGGSVRITGTAGADGSHDLKYAFNGFSKAVGSSSTATFDSLTGEVVQKGIWSGTSTFASTAMKLSATLEREGYEAASLSGDFSFQSTFDEQGQSGSVNGRPTVTIGTSSGDADGKCALYEVECGKTVNGIQVVGGPVPQDCPCPSGTTKSGVDNITPGGPYNLCTCDGL